MTARQSKPPLLFHAFSTFNVGGAEMRSTTLANRHGARFRHRIFAMDGRYAAADLLDPSVDFAIDETDHKKGRLAHNFLTFRRTLRHVQPDVLVSYNWGAIEWALANLGRPCRHIHIVDGFGPEEADRQLKRRVLFRRLVLGRNTTVVVPSRTLQDIATNIWRLDPASVAYIPNGIDCDRFTLPRNAALAAQFGISADATVIGTVAGLRREKNLERLLQAFMALPRDSGAHLVLVGDGAERAALEASAERHGIADRVTFTGYQSDPAAIIGLFDIFALSSDTEQMPISVLEAMAAELPVAGVDVGDVGHIVSEANKPFIVERDAAQIGAVLSEFVANPELRSRIGAQNRRHVRTVYGEAAMVDAYARLYDR